MAMRNPKRKLNFNNYKFTPDGVEFSNMSDYELSQVSAAPEWTENIGIGQPREVRFCSLNRYENGNPPTYIRRKLNF